MPNSRVGIIDFMNQLKVDNKQKYFALMRGLASRSSTGDRVIIILELGKLGMDAKGALPALKELKFSGIKAIRDAAERAMGAIE